jgi:hypothetical protein
MPGGNAGKKAQNDERNITRHFGSGSSIKPNWADSDMAAMSNAQRAMEIRKEFAMNEPNKDVKRYIFALGQRP